MDRDGVPLQPLEGGFSGETFVAQTPEERSVVRIYGDRSAWRGHEAPAIDAAILSWLRGLLPVPEVLEMRRPAADGSTPGLLVTSFLPGTRLDELKPRLDDGGLERVGLRLGVLLGRLAHIAVPRAGMFVDQDLSVVAFPDASDLPRWVARHTGEGRLAGWSPGDRAGLTALADDAQTLLDQNTRHCLVHSDVNPKNLLVDVDTLEVTGLLDWEFAHCGSPFTDLGNLLRFDREPALVAAVLAGYRGFVPDAPEDLLDRARASDLFALVELASRRTTNRVTERAHALLLAIVRAGDLHGLP